MLRRSDWSGAGVAFLCRIGLAVLAFGVAGCASQPFNDLNFHIPASDVCLAAPYSPFAVFISTSEPVCLPTDAPRPPPTDEFLSFEEWKVQRIEESTIMNSAKGTNPNPADPSFQMAEPVLDMNASATTDGVATAPLPSLRVPLTDRFNYASGECSARIQGASKAIKSPWAILNSKRDKYMLSPCSTKDRFIVIELCDDIQIDTIQLANFEFFSGVFKDISISAAQTYEADNWNFLGTYRAKNIRTVQSFLLPRDARFFRYVRVDFLSHYGSEYYCPVSLLRVYGLTQIEEYKWDEWQASWHRDHEANWRKALPPVSLEQPVVPIPTVTISLVSALEPGANLSMSAESSPAPGSTTISVVTASPSTASSISQPIATESPTLPLDIDAIIDEIMHYSLDDATAPTTPIPHSTPTHGLNALMTGPSSPSPKISSPSTAAAWLPDGQEPIGSNTPSTTSTSSSSTVPPSSSIQTPQSSPPPSVTAAKPVVVVASNQPRPPTGSAHAPGSESIYRNIMNRLTVLESNSTLGVRYMEEQTRYLRDALKRLEKDVGRLENLSNQHQTLYRKTALELRQHKQEMESERIAMLARLDNLSQEVIMEKRLGLAQLCLLLIVLIFMAFTRSASLGPPLHESGVINQNSAERPRRISGLWRFKRTASESDPPKSTTDRKSSVSATKPNPLNLTLQTPVPNPPINSAPPGPLGSPIRLSQALPAMSQESGSRQPKRAVSPPLQLLSYPVTSPGDGQSPFPPTSSASSSARRTLAKTAHLHEVGRRRKVSGPSGQGKQSSNQYPAPVFGGIYSPPVRPSQSTPVFAGDAFMREPMDLTGGDVFGDGSTRTSSVTPNGTLRRPRGRGDTSSGRWGQVPLSATPATMSSSSSRPRSLPRSTPKRPAREISRTELPSSGGDVSGSDVWEDTSDGEAYPIRRFDHISSSAHKPRQYMNGRSSMKGSENVPASLSPGRSRGLRGTPSKKHGDMGPPALPTPTRPPPVPVWVTSNNSSPDHDTLFASVLQLPQPPSPANVVQS
ncbi:hypothetical protein DL93DRAFT_1838288 [Clavulina sp. PMI_390]|nr:hypothetical protein DL93DRAFT_1838288 [Clavulina sp. PMI_390]